MVCNTDSAVLAADRDSHFGVLDMPFGYRESNFYMAQQACHGRPISQGIIARQLAPTLADHLNVGDLAVQKQQLVAARIKYIILHHPRDGMFNWNAQQDGDPRAYRRTYTVAADEADETIFRVY